MVDPTTINRTLAIPTHGSDIDTWNVPLNANFGLLDTITGGIVNIATTGGNTTLNAAQLACGTISVTGALVSNAGLIFPAVQGWWSIENLTTGASSVLFVSSGTGAGIICLPPGEITDIQINGNTAKFRNLARIGSYLDLAVSAIPLWILECSVSPYLICDGTTFSAVTYPYLNTFLGGNTLPDLRGRARFYLNGGTNRITTAVSGIDGDTMRSAGGNQNMQQHLHANTLGDPGHFHNLVGASSPFIVGKTTGGSGPSSPASISAAAGTDTLTGATDLRGTGMSITNVNTGSGVSQNMPPATISGITLIRAG